MRFFLFSAVMLVFLGEVALAQQNCDDAPCCISCLNDDGCDSFISQRRKQREITCLRDRTPAMIGDYFGGSRTRLGESLVMDRLMVFANDLDAPNLLPGAGANLSISEAGPVGIFATSIASVNQIQALLRAGNPLPAATLEGTIADSATLTTTGTVGQIQALIASTPQGYDIIGISAPPASYDAAVNGAFQISQRIPHRELGPMDFPQLDQPILTLVI